MVISKFLTLSRIKKKKIILMFIFKKIVILILLSKYNITYKSTIYFSFYIMIRIIINSNFIVEK